MAVKRSLAAFAMAYGLLHHQGFALGGLGDAGTSGTRWADWIDLVTPFAVLLPAAWTLWSLRPSGRLWLMFAVGAICYTEGHGIHLAANSINNFLGDGVIDTADAGTDPVHLWDELVGHWLWYGGVSLIFAALVSAVGGRSLATGRRSCAVAVALAVLVGTTYVTNALEGHFAVPALIVSTALALLALRLRRAGGWFRYTGSAPSLTGAELGVVAFGLAVLLLGFYGIWHRGFPDPTAVGWNPLAG